MVQLLFEKMLRKIPDVGKIFLLIKAKDKEATIHRLKTEVRYNIKIFLLLCGFIEIGRAHV